MPRRWSERVIPSPKRVLESWSALVGMWGASYLELLDELDVELGAVADTLEWPLLIVGALGTGSIAVSSWKASRTRHHRLPDRTARR